MGLLSNTPINGHDIENICYSFDELFTHIYIEAGYLLDNEKNYHYYDLPENKNIFDLASLTKAVVTVPLIFKELKNNIDITVKGLLQKSNSSINLDSRLEDLTIKNILSHKSGLPFWRNFYVKCLDNNKANTSSNALDVLNRAAFQLDQNPDKVYSDLGFILLGFLLEEINEGSLSDQFLDFSKSYLNLPKPILGELGFYDKIINKDKIIPTGYSKVRNTYLSGGLVHDENCAALNNICGHAGLFGSGKSLSFFLKSFISSKIWPSFFSLLSKNDFNLGWQPYKLEENILTGHFGYTGTAFWLYPKHPYPFIILLTNRVISDKKDISIFRRQIFRKIFL